jgi:hypothetical protein
MFLLAAPGEAQAGDEPEPLQYIVRYTVRPQGGRPGRGGERACGNAAECTALLARLHDKYGSFHAVIIPRTPGIAGDITQAQVQAWLGTGATVSFEAGEGLGAEEGRAMQVQIGRLSHIVDLLSSGPALPGVAAAAGQGGIEVPPLLPLHLLTGPPVPEGPAVMSPVLPLHDGAVFNFQPIQVPDDALLVLAVAMCMHAADQALFLILEAARGVYADILHFMNERPLLAPRRGSCRDEARGLR